MLVLVLLAAAGCGGGSGETRAPTKAAFIKQADAICVKADKAQEVRLNAAAKQHPLNVASEAELQKLVMGAGMPPIEDEAREIAELTPPVGDAAEIETLVQGIAEAVKNAKANPQSMADEASGPFSKVDQQAKQYGFKACSEAS